MSATDPTGQGGGNDPPPSSPPPTSDAPLPSNSQPLQLACACLNVVVSARVPDILSQRVARGPSVFIQGNREKIWLPRDAEVVKHRELATFERTSPFDRRAREAVEDESSVPTVPAEAWRKCWVCGVRVYLAQNRVPSDTAPSDVWVDVDFADGVLYGDALEKKQAEKPLPFSGLVLDIPKSSTFGRQPSSTDGPVPYPATGIKPQAAVLPPTPDPFFLPPPFIPSHPVLREICKQAVESLHERHDEIDRDIRAYIAKRAGDMRAIEDQVRAEVEALWDRFSDGPGAGDETTQRRGSGSVPRRDRSASPTVVARHSFDGEDRRRSSTTGPSVARRSGSRTRELARTSIPIPAPEAEQVSGVSTEPVAPFQGQHNVHTAQAAASLLSASLATNAFHGPQARRKTLTAEDDIENIVKTASNDPGLSREVAMSYAFSALDEHAAALTGRRKSEKKVERVAEQVEVEQEDAEKGIDSWINLERADAARRLKRDTSGMAVPTSVAEAKAEIHDKEQADGEKKETVGAATRERKSVQFQEPSAEEKHHPHKEERDDDDDDDNGAVFEFDTDQTPEPAVLPPRNAQAARERTMVDDNLSRAFAADAPSHRAAWRRFEARESMASVLRSQGADSDDDGEPSSPVQSNLARSMPVNIVFPKRERGPVQFKTSLTDRAGAVVPHLLHAMRRGSEQSGDGSSGEAGESEPGPGGQAGAGAGGAKQGGVRWAGGYDDDEERDGLGELDENTPPAAGLRAPRNSIAIGLGASYSGRRGSSSRDRDAAKGFGADPGAVFEALAEAAVDSEEESEDDDANGFVPPHVLAARRDEKPEVGWRSLANS